MDIGPQAIHGSAVISDVQVGTPPHYTEGHCSKFLVQTSSDLTERAPVM